MFMKCNNEEDGLKKSFEITRPIVYAKYLQNGDIKV